MGFLTDLVEQFFGKLQNGLAEEYQRQANKAGVHPIIAKDQHESAIRNYIRDEKQYLFELDFYKNDNEKFKKTKKNRLNYIIQHWGSEENYELFKQKIEEKDEKKANDYNSKLAEYNQRVQKEKEDFLKKHNT